MGTTKDTKDSKGGKKDWPRMNLAQRHRGTEGEGEASGGWRGAGEESHEGHHVKY